MRQIVRNGSLNFANSKLSAVYLLESTCQTGASEPVLNRLSCEKDPFRGSFDRRIFGRFVLSIIKPMPDKI